MIRADDKSPQSPLTSLRYVDHPYCQSLLVEGVAGAWRTRLSIDWIKLGVSPLRRAVSWWQKVTKKPSLQYARSHTGYGHPARRALVTAAQAPPISRPASAPRTMNMTIYLRYALDRVPAKVRTNLSHVSFQADAPGCHMCAGCPGWEPHLSPTDVVYIAGDSGATVDVEFTDDEPAAPAAAS